MAGDLRSGAPLGIASGDPEDVTNRPEMGMGFRFFCFLGQKKLVLPAYLEFNYSHIHIVRANLDMSIFM